MDLYWNKILLTWLFGEKQMKGDFDIYHSKYFPFLKKKWNFTVVWGFQLRSELSEQSCLRMESIFPKLCMFHSLFLYHPQNWLKMSKDSGIQTLSFCGPLCCSGGNCPFLFITGVLEDMREIPAVLKKVVIRSPLLKAGQHWPLHVSVLAPLSHLGKLLSYQSQTQTLLCWSYSGEQTSAC